MLFDKLCDREVALSLQLLLSLVLHLKHLAICWGLICCRLGFLSHFVMQFLQLEPALYGLLLVSELVVRLDCHLLHLRLERVSDLVIA